uniref:Uncharacterized protein n=1 Tax=Avena sativa TaxID=4498 RepID=A0ACD5VJW5_AVESA
MAEFGVAAFGAVAGVAVSKLCTVISKLRGQPNTDATFIKDELASIQAAIIQRLASSSGGHVSCLQIVWIAQLRCLAYDIEDCIDCFDANKTTPEDFANKIAALRRRSIDTTDRIRRYSFPDEAAPATSTGTSSSSHSHGHAAAPAELTDLLGDKSRQVWLVGNLNCLLYLCLFPRDHHVRAKPLIRLWVAEGLVQGEKNAVENLDILISNSIFNFIERSNNGKVKRCQRTDEMLRYISQWSMSENFILLCDGTAQLLEAGSARRLTVHPCAINGELMSLPDDLPRLRTLAVFPAGGGGGATSLASYEDVLEFAKYKVLRVLDLKECAHLREGHLRDICDQVLMKYLSINPGSINSCITRKIGDLERLETLDLSGAETVTVTVYKEVLLLPKLKHLLGKFELSVSDTLSVPILGFITSDLERFLRDKSVLQTLTGFVTGWTLGFPQLMSLMRRLRKVKIWCESSASKSNLRAISCAITKFIRDGVDQEPGRSLSIDFGKWGKFVTTTISPVKGRLASLKLRGNLRQFPQFVAQLSAIEELCLWSTELTWTDILQGLSLLGVLKYLKLIEDNLGRIEIRPEHLKSIGRISLVSVPALDITIQAGALLNLVSLHILCKDLLVMPGTPGIEITHMAKLREVALHLQVGDTIKTTWQQAASGHPKKPEVLLIPGP